MVSMKNVALLMVLIILPLVTIAVGPGGRCGGRYGGCPSGQCCSQYGYCGRGPQYCKLGMCQSQCMPDMPNDAAQVQAQTEAAMGRAQEEAYSQAVEAQAEPANGVEADREGRCGGIYGGCPSGQCCSKFGFCGKSSPFCPDSVARSGSLMPPEHL